MSRVLVTGGASGLGLALVRQFVAEGHQVLSTDVHADASAPDGAQYLQLNVRSADDWAAAAAWCEETWGGLDILVNNAGIATGGRIDVESLDEWDRVVDINLMGVVRGCRAFTPVFKRQRSGQIVNTASAAGLVHPPMMSSYNTVKAGVVALSETLSHELSPYGVSVSVVCPSFFRTNLGDSIQGDDAAMGATARQLIEKSPRTADEIAAGVIAGVKKKQFLIIPDRPALLAWRTKRFARPLYDRQMRKIAERARDKADAQVQSAREQQVRPAQEQQVRPAQEEQVQPAQEQHVQSAGEQQVQQAREQNGADTDQGTGEVAQVRSAGEQ